MKFIIITFKNESKNFSKLLMMFLIMVNGDDDDNFERQFSIMLNICREINNIKLQLK